VYARSVSGLSRGERPVCSQGHVLDELRMFSKSRSQFAKERFQLSSFGDSYVLAEVLNPFVEWMNFQGAEGNGHTAVAAIQGLL